ncbi:archease [Candidatus Parcubacteria bacterium]|nr:archease [Candidatus Parcubacteria bacterium]MBI4099138.1 archease [Candidatus Parcubacteria bacterium]MBI4385467.1 archease [Candidatus Parcubacteria bacterium]
MLPHTADLRARVFGVSLEDLFQNALAGFAHIIGAGISRGEPIQHKFALESGSATNLLIDFLNEALYCSNVEKAIFDQVTFSELSESKLVGILRGHRVDRFAEDVKAVTYHGAEIRQDTAGKFAVELVFDV